ncbi:hypothetical protein L226DRAFT_204858 [Lentinus tigrinus ALCF2SS1-7]|uniref:Uncharacterized protein n=1 Tax=Lentinus tigrinus ALCF2SS1-6 TaxID=1328759 RepID=A0A5C2RN82_9APHY|nr:hypothetical protein L227DRAFT_581923 [Lentinus tigrinus ALCF2SS1-6]RPD71238.1 hypothetical protein L226DRAFT_204858 [Lentinus tigrinus ALCF2SS1-7]
MDPRVALVNMSQIVHTALQQVEQIFEYEWSYLKESAINLALLTAFFGLSTVLALVAAYVLISKKITRRATALMLFAIVVMWASTTAYWIAYILVMARVYNKLRELTSQSLGGVVVMQTCLVSSLGAGSAIGNCSLEIPDALAFFHEAYWLRDCTETASLTVEVVIGDAIVWWRAWVLWPNGRIVRSVCIVMLLLTMVSGILDARYACIPAHSAASATADLDGSFLTLSGDIWGIVACYLSFLTNFVATVLIAYRALQHRRAIMSYLQASSRRTQVERTLALLVESGVLYCAVWVVVSIYATSDIFPNLKLVVFAEGFTYVMRDCLVPLIGIYPTLIITICAIDKSLYERSAHDAQLPSMQFDEPMRNRRGTLSELLSTNSTRTAVETSPRISSHDLEEIPSHGPTGIVRARPSGGPMDKSGLGHDTLRDDMYLS